ncbi:MAG: hypothetical protein HY721_35255 [Planctomycetes bacterium]|nr:hypothetical protein [Planctomycetota bacterium]
MASRVKDLENRVVQLEREVHKLKARLGREPQIPWYRRILGQFKDDPAFDEIVRLGRRIREAERRKTR